MNVSLVVKSTYEYNFELFHNQFGKIDFSSAIKTSDIEKYNYQKHIQTEPKNNQTNFMQYLNCLKFYIS
jgi:hypothetical protein